MLDRPISCQPFVAEAVELFTSQRSFLAHVLAKRCAGGGASEAGAWMDQKAGSARLRRASEGLQPWRRMPSSWPCRRTVMRAAQTFPDAPNFNCFNSNSVHAPNAPIRFRAL